MIVCSNSSSGSEVVLVQVIIGYEVVMIDIFIQKLEY